MPALKKNVLKFGYGINFKCKGMLVHPFDRCYVIIKFILSTINNLNFVPVDFDEKCNYLNADLHNNNQYWKEYITKPKIFCEKIIPFVHFYNKQISSHNCMLHEILNEISLISPNFPKTRKEKRGIITSLITGFIGLAYKGISSYLHNK